jgi:RNA polymerase sigma factor (sigma-70 family)
VSTTALLLQLLGGGHGTWADARRPERVHPRPEPGHNLEDLIVVPELIAGLPAEERRAVLLYFFAGLRQQEIADRIGHSQMHVSRLLKRTLTTMRNELLSGPPGAA